jgi:hypothetical protein
MRSNSERRYYENTSDRPKEAKEICGENQSAMFASFAPSGLALFLYAVSGLKPWAIFFSPRWGFI